MKTRIFSFSKQSLSLVPIEVEISLNPGLPQFQIIGLPDAAIRESQIRVKSALQAQGYTLPRTQKVVVNLKPSHIKKVSQGLDLAIALGFLLQTQQIKMDGTVSQKSKSTNVYFYGELGLDGSIQAPEDLSCLAEVPEGAVIYTGRCTEPQRHDIYSLNTLTDFSQPTFIPQLKVTPALNRPPLSELTLSPSAFSLACLIAAGEHSCLLAGPAGSGKTTLAQAIHSTLKNPSLKAMQDIQELNALFGYNCEWRPLVKPHHTIPMISLVGGGTPFFPGEITRAHRGVLILDELLEFHKASLETLRQPIESETITVARRGQQCTYPAKFLLLGTTNLCPCGKYIPKKTISCRYSLRKCRSYMEKLTGPMVDRFTMLYFTTKHPQNAQHTVAEVYKSAQKAWAFIQKRQQDQLNSQLSIKEIEPMIDPFVRENLIPELPESFRRRRSLYQVARTVADLNESEQIQKHHLNEAYKYTVQPFLEMEAGY